MNCLDYQQNTDGDLHQKSAFISIAVQHFVAGVLQ